MTQTSRPSSTGWNPQAQGSAWTTGRAEEGEAEARPTKPADMTRSERLTHMQRRLIEVHDAKLRRCWFCGEWAYGAAACTVCTAPANRADLTREGCA